MDVIVTNTTNGSKLRMRVKNDVADIALNGGSPLDWLSYPQYLHLAECIGSDFVNNFTVARYEKSNKPNDSNVNDIFNAPAHADKLLKMFGLGENLKKAYHDNCNDYAPIFDDFVEYLIAHYSSFDISYINREIFDRMIDVICARDIRSNKRRKMYCTDEWRDWSCLLVLDGVSARDYNRYISSEDFEKYELNYNFVIPGIMNEYISASHRAWGMAVQKEQAATGKA